MPSTPPTDASLQTWLETFLDEQIERQSLVGAVVVVIDRERTLASTSCGWAQLDPPRAMKLDDLFWVASQTKPITATALMMLVEAGDVSLDAPIEKYLPRLKDFWVATESDADRVLLKKAARPITLRDLLSHMSGMPFVSALEQPAIDAVPLRYLVDTYALTPLLTQPGSAYQYSNMGINVAGRVIEVVTGSSFDQFVTERIFDPLGMRDTGFHPTASRLERLALAYGPDAEKKKYIPSKLGQLSLPYDSDARQSIPAGGLFSTASDIARFCTMLLNAGRLDGHHYLAPASIEEMTRRQTPPSIKDSYGLGWTVDGRRFAHAGAAGSTMVIDPVTVRAMIFMVQLTGYLNDGDKVRNAIESVAFGAM